LEATIDAGEPRKLEASSPSPGEVVLRDEKGRVVRALVARGADGEIWVSIGGRVARLSRRDERRARSHASHDTALEVPMPGTCRDVLVRAGDRVEKGALLVIVEAMKMEHEVRSPRAGVVKAVHAKKGEAVSPGTPLVEIEPFDAPA
ncbi:biotin/lipoyl-binding protein, partial [bacterium]|nr:biotin/lipoyl-binding protein [bacterium]